MKLVAENQRIPIFQKKNCPKKKQYSEDFWVLMTKFQILLNIKSKLEGTNFFIFFFITVLQKARIPQNDAL